VHAGGTSNLPGRVLVAYFEGFSGQAHLVRPQGREWGSQDSLAGGMVSTSSGMGLMGVGDLTERIVAETCI